MAIHGIGGGQGPGQPDQVGNRKIDESSFNRDHAAKIEGGDRVELSPEARQIIQLAEQTRQLPEIREDRVAALRQQLADGTYNVDPQQVAASILEEDGVL